MSQNNQFVSHSAPAAQFPIGQGSMGANLDGELLLWGGLQTQPDGQHLILPTGHVYAFSSNALWDKTRSFWDIKNSFSHKQGSELSERASEHMSAVEGASEVSSPEQAVRANKRMDKQVAQYLRLVFCLSQTTVHWRHWGHLVATQGRNTILWQGCTWICWWGIRWRHITHLHVLIGWP